MSVDLEQIAQGEVIKTANEGSQQTSSLVYDAEKSVQGATVRDFSAHPSHASFTPEKAAAGVVREEVARIEKGRLDNIHVPDWMPRYWQRYLVEFRNYNSDIIFWGERWNNVYGRTAVEVLRKESESGVPQQTTNIYVSIGTRWNTTRQRKREGSAWRCRLPRIRRKVGRRGSFWERLHLCPC